MEAVGGPFDHSAALMAGSFGKLRTGSAQGDAPDTRSGQAPEEIGIVEECSRAIKMVLLK